MADISKIKTIDGTVYNIKDTTARAQSGVTGVKGSAENSYRTGNVNVTADNVGAVPINGALFTTNPFISEKLRKLYISKIDNAFYCADKRWNVTCTVNGSPYTSVAQFFDGNYEGNNQLLKNGATGIITMDFTGSSGTGHFPGYPYGYIYVSFYYVARPASISARMYCDYQAHGIGWHDLTCEQVESNLYRIRQPYYNMQTLEITIVGDTTNSYGYTSPCEIEMYLDRPDPSNNPYLTKYTAQTLYYTLTAPKFVGDLQGNADTATKATKDASGNTITSYYAPKSTAVTNVALATNKITKTINGTTTDVVTAATTSTYGITKLSTSTSSTATDVAATPSAVKTAYDLANTANGTANSALSGVNGNLIYDHTFSISNGIATFTPHVYQKGTEVTSNYAASCFTWKYRLIDGSEVTLTTKSDRGCDVTITSTGYGGHVIGIFTPA